MNRVRVFCQGSGIGRKGDCQDALIAHIPILPAHCPIELQPGTLVYR